ncbi:hypothetical protein RMSM_01598 [Rhodopirellula maiorica SM1]|uniref:Uncharacterized protein n=1 Tax=Rhodopirellula maiorica SM1 TaxID=1265738 RepID=M5S5I6_9BACT|nr:hypothetical protein RMSM_01598 [Rhodopirellula maiorica SM1]
MQPVSSNFTQNPIFVTHFRNLFATGFISCYLTSLEGLFRRRFTATD